MVAISKLRAGMTLVELLVVVSILGLLAVAVLPNIANTADDRRSREAVRSLTSFIAKAQSRAIGRTEWAGFTLKPATTNAAFAIDLFLADVPLAYRGDSFNASVTLTASGAGAAPRQLSFQGGSPTSAGVLAGDLIRFDGHGPWFELSTGAATCSVRSQSGNEEMAGQNPLNTPWPAESVGHSFEILRQPSQAGSPFTMADGRCVDLFWSGHGSSSAFSNFGSAAVGQSLTVLFDASGRLRQIVQGNTRITPQGPLMLLVGKSDRAGQSAVSNPTDDTLGANWQYADSYWILVDPQSGICKSAECVPSAAGVDASQAFIRSEITTGAR